MEVSRGWRPLNNFTVVKSSSDENRYLSCGQLITATMNAPSCDFVGENSVVPSDLMTVVNQPGDAKSIDS